MSAYYCYCFTFVSTVIFILLYRRRRRQPDSNYCPCSYPLIGNLLGFVTNRHKFLDWATELLSSSPTGTIEVYGPLGISRGICTADPASVDYILRSNFSNYVKGDRFGSNLSDLLGSGIFKVDGSLWSVQRKLASRAFTTRSLRSFVASAVESEITSRLLPLLYKAADSGDLIDLQDILRRFAFDNICAVAFGTDPEALCDGREQTDTFFAAFDEAVELSAARFYSPFPLIWKVQRFFGSGSEKKLRRAITAIDDYAMNVIANREQQQQEGHVNDQEDLLSKFMAAVVNEEYSGELRTMFVNDEERRRFLRDIVVSFILAGKDTTSSTLTWFFWLLSKNRECEAKIVKELSLRCSTTFNRYEELKDLNYLHAALTETLRLYPPVPINSRVAVADDRLPDGTVVKAGWFADYSAYAMARMESVWGPHCHEFVPERWIDEKGEFVPADEPAKFPVFHAGPRTCLGKEMAYVQMKAVTAEVLKQFDVAPVIGGYKAATPAYELSLTLRMKGGFPVYIRRRNTSTSDH